MVLLLSKNKKGEVKVVKTNLFYNATAN